MTCLFPTKSGDAPTSITVRRQRGVEAAPTCHRQGTHLFGGGGLTHPRPISDQRVIGPPSGGHTWSPPSASRDSLEA